MSLNEEVSVVVESSQNLHKFVSRLAKYGLNRYQRKGIVDGREGVSRFRAFVITEFNVGLPDACRVSHGGETFGLLPSLSKGALRP